MISNLARNGSKINGFYGKNGENQVKSYLGWFSNSFALQFTIFVMFIIGIVAIIDMFTKGFKIPKTN